MARADLVLNLVETGIRGDLPRFKKTAEAIAAEASARHQHILANKLKTLLTATPSAEERRFTRDESLQNAFYEIQPQKVLSDLVLPDEVINLINEVIEEHARRDLLRSFNLEPRHKLLFCGAPGNGKQRLRKHWRTTFQFLSLPSSMKALLPVT